uniref:phage tail tape measure protein n=1 Tax=Ruminococcus sp. TaxID=41978 RepID=UPI0025E8702C
MANRIKGITVEIGGDTTKLSKALEGVNKNIKNTQTQLKDVQKLLKLDPTNTELLSQKHKLLADAVKATKEKLETLKTSAEQANQALANGDISQEQYDALQREIIETEQKLQNLQREAEASSTALAKLGQAGEMLEKAGDKIADVGTTLTTHVTVPVMAAGTAAVKTAADFDSAMSKVAAVSGATGDELDALRDKAREMGAKTKFSASEAADAMNYMAMAGWKTGDMLDGIEGIMNLAAASGEDLATTSDIVTDALTAFGLSAADSGHFADVLAAASSNANTNVSMMGETFKYCAPVAGSLGFSCEDTAQAIGLMANSGIKGSQSGTALRSIMTALAGEVKFCGDAFGEMEIATTNQDGSMRELNDILADCRVAFAQMSESEQASAAQALVGKNAMSGFLALMNAAPADIQKLEGAISTCSDEIDGYNGVTAKMAAVMQDNLGGQLTILKSQLQELAISFGEILMPAIRAIVTKIQGFIDKLNAMDPATKETIVKIALVAAALGPL